jgi:hypothetical protein
MAYSVNMEQRAQHRLLAQTHINLQNGLGGCQRFGAKNTEGGEQHRHLLTSSSVATGAKLPLKCILCLQIVAQALDVSARDAQRHHIE